MAECFSALTSLIDVAVITGGKYALLKSQVVERLTGQANRANLHLMPTSGTRYYRWDGANWMQVFAHDLSEEDRAKAYESLERNARGRTYGSPMFGASASKTAAARSRSPHWGSLHPLRPRRHGIRPTRRKIVWRGLSLPICRILRCIRAEPAALIFLKKTLTSRLRSGNWPIFLASRWTRSYS